MLQKSEFGFLKSAKVNKQEIIKNIEGKKFRVRTALLLSKFLAKCSVQKKTGMISAPEKINLSTQQAVFIT